MEVGSGCLSVRGVESARRCLVRAMLVRTETLKILAGLTRQPTVCAGLAARRLLQAHAVDLQLHRVVGGYSADITETLGEAILFEVSVHVPWDQLAERERLQLLQLYCRQVLEHADRCKRRSDAAVAVALRDARARFGP